MLILDSPAPPQKQGKLRWLFFPDQCRHCIEAPCEATAGEPTAIFTEAATGAVIYTAGTRELDAAEARADPATLLQPVDGAVCYCGPLDEAPLVAKGHRFDATALLGAARLKKITKTGPPKGQRRRPPTPPASKSGGKQPAPPPPTTSAGPAAAATPPPPRQANQ